MKVLIIEDELLAQAKLEKLLLGIDPAIQIIAKLGSVKETVAWLRNNSRPDLAFVDIQLSDDHSFEIFKHVDVHFPVIFTTAYDKYLLESFEYNAIDYLLKPISEEKLRRSIDKVRKLEQHFIEGNLLKLVQRSKTSLDRIVVKKGMEFMALELTDVAYFYTDHRIVFVRDFSGRQFIVDKTLGELESSLDNNLFFRINRKYIANLKAVEKFKPDNGKIRIFLRPGMNEDIHVSKETAPLFRKWVSADQS